MECISDLVKKITINTFDVGSEHWVNVTHINHPHSFYVRPTAYRKHLPVLHSPEDRLLPEEVHLGSEVIYESKLLQFNVRGRVLSIKYENEGENTCDLFASDYGCVDFFMPLTNLFKPFYSANVPPLAIHCQLVDCQPLEETWSKKSIESMKFFIGKDKAKMVIRGKASDYLIVQLFNLCPDDISTMLAYDGCSTLGFGDNAVSRLTTLSPKKHFYVCTQYKLDETFTVRMQSGDSLKGFYVARLNDYKKYLNENKNLMYLCTAQREIEPEKVKVGMPVSVLMAPMHKYERAVVTDIAVPDKKAEVMLVDWGRLVSVPFKHLKAMPEKFFSWPITVIYCKALPCQLRDNHLYKLRYPGSQFNITIKHLGEPLDTPHIVKISPL